MTQEQLIKFENELQQRGYRKYSAHNSADYAWYKSFGKSKYDEDRSNYQIAFNIYDFSPYAHRDEYIEKHPYRCTPTILFSRIIDERADLDLATIDYTNIEAVEKLAESFALWAEENMQLKQINKE